MAAFGKPLMRFGEVGFRVVRAVRNDLPFESFVCFAVGEEVVPDAMADAFGGKVGVI